MKRVGIVMHETRPAAVETGRRLLALLADRGIAAEAAPGDAARLGGGAEAGGEEFPKGVDLVVALGGDGTLLRAAALAARADVPLLGVNLGRLGFLAELEAADLESAIDRIASDGFEIEERTVIEGTVAGTGERLWALNDVVVAKAAVSRGIELALAVGGEPLATIAADALIVATPTGSTAYSFSAHGPIVAPGVDCLVVTPVSPHGLFDRAVVLPADETARVEVLGDRPGMVSLDGHREIPLPPGDAVELSRAERRLMLAKVAPLPFWRLVREKFGFPGPPGARRPGGEATRGV